VKASFFLLLIEIALVGLIAGMVYGYVRHLSAIFP
jgi:hypothetical protein